MIVKGAAVVSLATVLAFWSVSLAGDTDRFGVSLKYEIEHSIDQGLLYLAQSQLDDGSWSQYPGVTGLVLTAFLRAPESIEKKHIPNIGAGLHFIGRFIHDDGGIYPDEQPQLRAYNTSICLMALSESRNPDIKEIIKMAREYIMEMQADEDEGISPDSSTYGGIGYNKDERSDISNMQFALEAMRESEAYLASVEGHGEADLVENAADGLPRKSKEDLFWEKAIAFLQRCQNYKKYNDYQWSGDDGGFVYYPGVSKAGGTTSYGGMTYAGMKSFIHAGLSKDDERVQAAYDWIRGNYTVEENPELGKQGLFYYYHVMARALTVLGKNTITDTSGVSHDWRADLAEKLMSIQHSDGHWVNDSGRWWENNPDLVTAYCVLALEEIIKQ